MWWYPTTDTVKALWNEKWFEIKCQVSLLSFRKTLERFSIRASSLPVQNLVSTERPESRTSWVIHQQFDQITYESVSYRLSFKCSRQFSLWWNILSTSLFPLECCCFSDGDLNAASAALIRRVWRVETRSPMFKRPEDTNTTQTVLRQRVSWLPGWPLTAQ